MSIARVDVSTYLDTQFSSLAESIGQLIADDSPDGYGSDVDDALRKLGYTESALVDAEVGDELRDALFALAQYYAAKRIWIKLGDRVDHTMGQTVYDFKSQKAHAKAIMDDAANTCALLGHSVDGRLLRAAPSFVVF
jgi:hypothetical protein